MALPPVHEYACSAVHSDLEVGLDNAKMIGCSFISPIFLTIDSLKAPV